MILAKVVQSNLIGHLKLNHNQFDDLYSKRSEFRQVVWIDAKHEWK